MAIEVTDNSSVTISNLYADNVNKAISADGESSLKVSDSIFMRNGDLTTYGGSISTDDSNLIISSSNFTDCMAMSGGCLSLRCKPSIECDFEITDSMFEYSIASIQGGAIYYDLQRPEFNNIMFTNNSSPYGPDIASYPVYFKFTDDHEKDLTLTDVASGQLITPGLEFSLVDFDDQVVTTHSQASMSIQNIEQGTQVGGFKKVIVTNGSAVFDDINLQGTPGTNDSIFDISSTFIDYDRLQVFYNRSEVSHEITVSFRECESGEFLQDDT